MPRRAGKNNVQNYVFRFLSIFVDPYRYYFWVTKSEILILG